MSLPALHDPFSGSLLLIRFCNEPMAALFKKRIVIWLSIFNELELEKQLPELLYYGR